MGGGFRCVRRVEPGFEGLCHVTELSEEASRIRAPWSDGETISVMVLDVEPEAQRISLSLKR